jgi:uncharacterized protein (TIGR01244 family)
LDNAQITAIFNYRPVDEKLATAGQPTVEQLAAVAHEGFAVVVNLLPHDHPRYALPGEPDLVRSLGMKYVYIPVVFDAPTEADLVAFFGAMEEHAGAKVFVHCAANWRVSAFLGLYRAIKKGEPTDEAFALMKTVWEPNEVWESFISATLEKHRGASQ